MAQSKRQDLGTGPEDEALEQRVKEMLDITIPDKPEPTPEPAAKAPLNITVVDHTDSTVEPVKTTDPAMVEAIEQANEQLAAQTETAPLVPDQPPKKATKVTVTHADDQPEVPPEETPETTAIEVPEAEPESEATEPADPAETPELTKTVQEAIDEAEPESPLEDEINSTDTEQAVNDIVAKESDELLAVQDGAVRPKSKPAKRGGLRRFLSAWGHSSGARWLTFLVLFGALVAAGLTPQSRYYVLNKAGVTSSASVVVADAVTQRPLKNVTVSLAGKTVQTDQDGKASFSELRLGPTELVVSKRAFVEERKNVTLGWGSNPLSDVSLRANGARYVFVVSDFLSGKPLATAQVTAGESSAVADGKGRVTLTLDETDKDTVDISISAEGYRTEQKSLQLAAKEEIAVPLVSAQRAAFISTRNGTYDIYTTDIDGANEKLVLAGTGNEASDLVFAPSQVNNKAALISTRDGKRSSGGGLLQSLAVVDLAKGEVKPVIESPQIRLIDWVGSRVVYAHQVTDASAEDAARHKLMSYDVLSGDNRQLATANYFNSVIIMANKVYYAPASAYQNGVNVGVFAVQADGSGKAAVLDKEAWNMYRTTHDKLAIAVQQDWYELTAGATSAQKLSGQPANTIGRVYVDSPGAKQSLWLDSRDGKATILAYDITAKTDKIIYANTAVKQPLRWLSNAIFTYRVTGPTETAEYVMSTEGGEPKKLADVTDVIGVERWSY